MPFGIGVSLGLGHQQTVYSAEDTFSESEFSALAASWDLSEASSVHITSGEVLQLDDLSGNGRDLTAGGGSAPTYNATGGPDGGHCMDIGAFTAIRRSSFVAAQAYTLIMVVKTTADDGYIFQHFDFSGVIHGLQFGIDSSGNWKLSHTAGGGVQTDGAAGSAWQVVTVRGGTGASFTPEIRVNGTLVSAFSGSAYSAPGASTWATGLGFLHGGNTGTISIAKAWLCDANELDAIIARAESSLLTRFGI